MKYFSIKRYVKLLVVLGSVLLLSACASTDKQADSTADSIEDRANGRWAALFSNDIKAAYAYLTPGYRSSVSLQQYERALAMHQLKWTSAKYVESKCEANTCEVKLLVGFTVYGALPGVRSYNGTQYVNEAWVLVEGNWYMVPPQ
jgi:hypothetical protein